MIDRWAFYNRRGPHPMRVYTSPMQFEKPVCCSVEKCRIMNALRNTGTWKRQVWLKGKGVLGLALI